MSEKLEDLEQIIRESKAPLEVKRALCVKMASQAVAVSSICEFLGVSQAFVSKWRRLYREEGAGALALGYWGTQGYLDAQQRAQVVAWIREQTHLNVSRLRVHLQEQYGVVYRSKQSYYQLLHEARWSYHKTQKSNPKRDEEQVQERREQIKKKLAQHWQAIESGELIVLMQDECHLLWGDVCGYAWGPRGEVIEVPLLNQRERQTYYGALNFRTGQLHLREFGAGNALNTIAYLQWLVELYPDKKLLLLWDGASYHRDHRLKEYLATINGDLDPEQWRLTLMPFAPNAPEQNPIEDVWLAGKNHLRESFAQLTSFAQVKGAFRDFLHKLSFKSAKFDWYNPSLQPI